MYAGDEFYGDEITSPLERPAPSDPIGSWTVNVSGDVAEQATAEGYHAYHANGVTAIEVGRCTRDQARARARRFGRVLYIFE